MTILDIECVFSYIDSTCHELYNKSTEMIFNSFDYDTYYGNLAHGICEKVQALLRNGYIYECHPYIHLLFIARYEHNLQLNSLDGYMETPLERARDPHCHGNHVPTLRLLEKLVDPSYCIITVAQSFVRRWLAMRRIQRLKLRRVLDHILTAPSQQIECNRFPQFPGGQCYIKAIDDFRDHVVQELVDSMI
jgi:hypothetical protein